MKLLLCEDCWDVFKLAKEVRQCSCGKVKGRYIDNSEAEVSANAVSIALGNGSLQQSILQSRRLQKLSNDEAPREAYYEEGNGKIDYAWVRPNTGNGNPHCKIME